MATGKYLPPASSTLRRVELLHRSSFQLKSRADRERARDPVTKIPGVFDSARDRVPVAHHDKPTLLSISTQEGAKGWECSCEHIPRRRKRMCSAITERQPSPRMPAPSTRPYKRSEGIAAAPEGTQAPPQTHTQGRCARGLSTRVVGAVEGEPGTGHAVLPPICPTLTRDRSGALWVQSLIGICRWMPEDSRAPSAPGFKSASYKVQSRAPI